MAKWMEFKFLFFPFLFIHFVLCREFKEEDGTKEIFFPTTLTQHERAYIKQTAQELGLKVEGKEVYNVSLSFS